MRRLPLLATILIAGCVPRAEPPPAPVPPPAAPPPASPAPAPAPADWRDRPRTPGDWRQGADMATYADPAGRALLTLACDRTARQVWLTRPSPVAATALTVRTTSTVRALPARTREPADAAPLVMVEAALPTTDRLLDAMAFSRGRFAIEQPGQPALIVPAWAEIGRLIEDCRR